MNLREFFIHEVNSDFEIAAFSIQNIVFIAIAILTVFLTLRYATRIKKLKHEKEIKHFVAYSLILLEVTYHIHNIANGVVSFPLHISSFSMILSILILFTDDERFFNTLFFFGVLGGITAFLMPDMLHYTFYHMRFYNFVLIHVGIIAVPLYYFKAYNYKLKLKSMYKIYIFLIFVAPLIITANKILDKNYMFIGQKPDIITDYLPKWPYFILIYLALIFVFFHILYYITKIKLKRNQ